MKESEGRIGLGERLTRGAGVIGTYGYAFRKRIEAEIKFQRDKIRSDRLIKRAKSRGIEGLDTTSTQKKYIDVSDSVSIILNNYDPKDIDSLMTFLDYPESAFTDQTQSAAILSRRIEQSLNREEATLEQIRGKEKEVRLLTLKYLRELIKR